MEMGICVKTILGMGVGVAKGLDLCYVDIRNML